MQKTPSLPFQSSCLKKNCDCIQLIPSQSQVLQSIANLQLPFSLSTLFDLF